MQTLFDKVQPSLTVQALTKTYQWLVQPQVNHRDLLQAECLIADPHLLFRDALTFTLKHQDFLFQSFARLSKQWLGSCLPVLGMFWN